MDDSRDSDSMDRLETMLLKNSYQELPDRNKEFFNPAGDIVTVNKDCCVRTLLASVVLGTAFALIVIAVSAKDNRADDLLNSNSMTGDSLPDVYWTTDQSDQPRLKLRHQYLVREIKRDGYAQIMALDEASKVYVIEVLNERVQFYKQYVVVDLDKGTETFLLVSRDTNKFSSDYVEKTVLVCLTQRMAGWEKDLYVPTITLGKSSVFQAKLHNDVVEMEYVYIGDWMTAPAFLSTVVNASCRHLPQWALFQWGRLDESLACGSNVSMTTDTKSCPPNVCSPLNNTPQTRVASCRKFRQCNYVTNACGSKSNQDSQITPHMTQQHPYCACRKAAAADALHLTCPRVKDDGGECEYPRRDLYSSQRSLPCQCQYSFPLIYPFERNSNYKHDREETFAHEKKQKVNWQVRFESKIGPAKNFRKCLC